MILRPLLGRLRKTLTAVGTAKAVEVVDRRAGDVVRAGNEKIEKLASDVKDFRAWQRERKGR